MTTLDFILEGLEAELALERELGVRSLEIDRALLAPLQAPVAPQPPAPVPIPAKPVPVPAPKPAPAPAPAKSGTFDFIFLHERPLRPMEREMMDKIVVALGKAPETAPVLSEPPVPDAKIRVVLGQYALRKWFPDARVEPGSWFTDEKGREILYTHAPSYVLRFKVMTPALKKLKLAMWTSLKSILKHLNVGE